MVNHDQYDPILCPHCFVELLTHDKSDAFLPPSKLRYEAKGYELDENRILFVEHTETRCTANLTPKNNPI